MNEETFNMSTRKFLKKLGITAQREIEKAVWTAKENGTLTQSSIPVKVQLTVEGMDVDLTIDGDIALD